MKVLNVSFTETHCLQHVLLAGLRAPVFLAHYHNGSLRIPTSAIAPSPPPPRLYINCIPVISVINV
jgi:hypothetical protein